MAQHLDLIAAAAVAVGAVDHLDVEIGQIAVGQAVHEPGQVAGRGINLAAVVAPALFLGLGLDGLGAFGEDADPGRVAHARLAFGTADDVIVQIGLDAPALGLGVVGQDLAAQQSLFLAGQGGEDQGGVKAVFREDPRGLQHGGHARGVVIGAGGVGGEIHHVGDPAVDVAGDDDDAVGIACAALDGDDVHHLCRRRHAGGGDRVGRRHYGKTAAAVAADRFEFALGPAARGADAAGVGGRLRHRVAGAESNQRLDVGAHPLRPNFRRQLVQQDLLLNGLGCGGGRSQDRSGKGDRQRTHRRPHGLRKARTLPGGPGRVNGRRRVTLALGDGLGNSAAVAPEFAHACPCYRRRAVQHRRAAP